MRVASIHISEPILIKVLKKSITSYDNGQIEELANEIMMSAKKYSLTHRNITVDKAKLIKSTSKVVLSTRDDASAFSQLLYLIRKQQKHRGISIVKVGSREWLMIKEAAKLAKDFCNDFNIKRDEGFKIYIGIALSKMNKYSLMKFNSLHQTICEEYDSVQKIREDLTPKLTDQARTHYEKLLGEKGIVRDYSKSPDKYIYFIKVKEECSKYQVSIKDYIKSQFAGLEWANAIPDPAQLVGPKAIDRLNKYLVEHNIKPGSSSKAIDIDKLAKELKSRIHGL